MVGHPYLIGKVRLALLAQQEKLMSSERRLRLARSFSERFRDGWRLLLIQQRRPVEQQTDRAGLGSGGSHRHKSLAVDLAGIDTQALDISFLISYANGLPDTRIRREFQCFRSKWPEKPAFVSKIFAAVARFSDYQLSQIILSLVYPIILGLDRMVAPRITQMPS